MWDKFGFDKLILARSRNKFLQHYSNLSRDLIPDWIHRHEGDWIPPAWGRLNPPAWGGHESQCGFECLAQGLGNRCPIFHGIYTNLFLQLTPYFLTQLNFNLRRQYQNNFISFSNILFLKLNSINCDAFAIFPLFDADGKLIPWVSLEWVSDKDDKFYLPIFLLNIQSETHLYFVRLIQAIIYCTRIRVMFT